MMAFKKLVDTNRFCAAKKRKESFDPEIGLIRLRTQRKCTPVVMPEFVTKSKKSLMQEIRLKSLEPAGKKFLEDLVLEAPDPIG